jgi:hypothetical protein
LKCARLLDHANLSPTKGPYDGFGMAEKVATHNFIEKAGLGTSPSNQRQYRCFWKSLFDIRKAGVEIVNRSRRYGDI